MGAIGLISNTNWLSVIQIDVANPGSTLWHAQPNARLVDGDNQALSQAQLSAAKTTGELATLLPMVLF